MIFTLSLFLTIFRVVFFVQKYCVRRLFIDNWFNLVDTPNGSFISVFKSFSAYKAKYRTIL